MSDGLFDWDWVGEPQTRMLVLRGAYVFATRNGSPQVVVSGDDKERVRSLAFRVQDAREELRWSDSYEIYPNYDVTQHPIGRVQIYRDHLYGREKQPDVQALASCALVPAVSFHKEDVVTGEVAPIRVENFGMVARTKVDTRPTPELGEK